MKKKIKGYNYYSQTKKEKVHHVLLWCVCLCVGVCTVFLGCLSQTGWCPLTFVSIIDTGCFHQPMTAAGGVQPRSPPSPPPPPHISTRLSLWARGNTRQPSVVPKTKNTTFSNVIMLLCVSLKLVRSHHFSSRRGGNYICICVSLVWCCHASSWFHFF